MTFETYTREVTTLTTFVSCYCNDKHGDRERTAQNIALHYGTEEGAPIEATLCDECLGTVEYGMMRLKSCPFDEKPKCRKCPDPCYERPMWKKVAGIMRYSGIRLGVLKVRSRLRGAWRQ